MRILFLNQYFPPDPAPTGILLRELSDALSAEGHVVDFVAARQSYRTGQQRGHRLWREFKALVAMLVDGILRPRVDLVISASSPPCLVAVAVLVAIRHRARSIHWVMDLYPEIAVALGEVRPGLPVRIIQCVMGWSYRYCDAVVALDEDMAEKLRRYRIRAEIIRPWVFESLVEFALQSKEHRSSANSLSNGHSARSAFLEETRALDNWTWIYSGNLGRAHEWETLLSVQSLLEESEPRMTLLFQGGGPSWPAARARAQELGLKRCEWKPYVSENELAASLLRCHCCVITQLPATQGLLWPSKLGFALTLPRPLLWIGPPDGAIARQLRKIAHAGVFAPGQVREIANWLRVMRTNEGMITNAHRDDARTHRLASLEAWRKLIRALEMPLHGEN
ncbi:MAG: putative Colanic acid biosynthesis glycosyl transferase [Chthoniobacteraceae bacterium]|nr:putative Colanic acid biosynthesis glycosyl transferase [Chthoniobacteraceae bacterium]